MKVKGFTLIELLAVIVILAIIALIAVPIILDLIGNTKVSAVKRSAENYIDAVELYLVRSEIDNNRVTLDRNNRYNVTTLTVIGEKNYPSINDLVEITGSKPTGADDYVQLNQKGQVTDAKLTINGYEIEIKNGKITNVKGGKTIPLENIKLNYTEQTMENGSNFKLIPIFAPVNASNQEVEYSSSDESIVTVDALGNVTAKEVGQATITVTSKENSNIKAECNITVVLSATGLTIFSEEAEVDAGKTLQLTGIIEPSNATTNSLTWTSSNADIASVDSNGLVTGISEGEVTITSRTVNGIEATIDITVYPFVEAPDLYNSLTPVVYENNNWKVADTTKRWYNYYNQEWANAVILKSGVTKNVGDTINVSSEVQGMFVWIPRYQYKIDGTYGKGGVSAEQPGEIEVKFISKATQNASNGYIIHPAFTFGTTIQSGIWIGKFETSNDVTSACYESESSIDCNNTNQIPYILPNVKSLRYQTVENKFKTAQKFNTYINNLNVDAHMAKNSEWGVVAYLSQSKYGKYGNSNYTGINKQVMINNCSNNITGVGSDIQDDNSKTSTCTTNTYETAKGQAASTTGNITGVYDMNGGAFEAVMGVYNKITGSSGFTENTWPAEKYYDNYTSLNVPTACNGGVCYGHALNETSGWYQDYSIQFTDSSPWINRGSNFDGVTDAGIFGFSNATGTGYGNRISFRIILTRS